jgi:RimJ/RimL family protein N-acetyltransferase
MVSLRCFQPDDVEHVHRWFNNREATKTLVEQRKSFSKEEAREWIRRAIDDPEDDRKYAILVEGHEDPVGFTALYGLFSREQGPELGAMVGDNEFRHRGIGSRAEALTIFKAFEEFGVNRVYGEIPAFNVAAKKAVTKLGWRHEETLPEQRERDGESFDCEVWAVAPGDFYAAMGDLLSD